MVRNKKYNIFIYCAIVLAAAVLIFIFWKEEDTSNSVCFNDKCFHVELARTPDNMERGLMYRKSLAQNAGMLFIFEESGAYSFWMKNTLIPLDIIWINQDKEVVFISENTQPCIKEPCQVITPSGGAAKYVLELNAGTAEKIGLKESSVLEFDY
jgi:uncharacterized protein